MNALTRPALRWHGGKWRLAPWIVGHFPAHRVYVEPFGGAASVLLRKQRAYAEIYNDLDGLVVNLFRVLRDREKAGRLIAALRLTPFARVEFEDAQLAPLDDVDRARRLIVRSFMGFGSNAHSLDGGGETYCSTGFRAHSNRSGTTPAHDWASYPDALAAIVERVAGVVIENADAMSVMKRHDGPSTLHYVDPPYLPATRSLGNKYDPKHRYRHEMTAGDHRDLLAFLGSLAGFVALSGYPHSSYDEALAGWRRVERKSYADGARERTEALWLNPAAADALGTRSLFDAR